MVKSSNNRNIHMYNSDTCPFCEGKLVQMGGFKKCINCEREFTIDIIKNIVIKR